MLNQLQNWILKKLVLLCAPVVLVRMEPLKTRHDVTNVDLTIIFLSFWCINIDLIIQPMSLTLYMTWVH